MGSPAGVSRSDPTGQVWFLWAVNSGQSCKMYAGVWFACVQAHNAVRQVDPSQVGMETEIASSQATYDSGPSALGPILFQITVWSNSP